MQSCFKDAAEGSKTASSLDGVFVFNEFIEWDSAFCDPAMKAVSAIIISAFTVI